MTTWTRLLIFAFGCAALTVWADGNLLRNPSFEERIPDSERRAQYWTMHHPDAYGDTFGSASREDWRSFDGLFIMAIRGLWANAGHYGGVWQESAAEPGETYKASARFWADPDWEAATQEIKLEFWTADYNELLATKSTVLRRVGPDWRQYTVQAKAPEGAERVRLVIFAEGAGEYGALQFDHTYLSTLDEYQEPEAHPVSMIIDILEE